MGRWSDPNHHTDNPAWSQWAHDQRSNLDNLDEFLRDHIIERSIKRTGIHQEMDMGAHLTRGIPRYIRQ
jgi:hypothetical protein